MTIRSFFFWLCPAIQFSRVSSDKPRSLAGENRTPRYAPTANSSPAVLLVWGTLNQRLRRVKNRYRKEKQTAQEGATAALAGYFKAFAKKQNRNISRQETPITMFDSVVAVCCESIAPVTPKMTRQTAERIKSAIAILILVFFFILFPSLISFFGWHLAAMLSSAIFAPCGKNSTWQLCCQVLFLPLVARIGSVYRTFKVKK